MPYFINTTMMETFKTGYTTIPTPNKGETWWVKFPGAKALSEVVVTDVTAHTVELESKGYYGVVNRYVREDVQFVEKVYQ